MKRKPPRTPPAEPARLGRPSLIHDERVRAAILTNLRAGGWKKEAFAAEGVAEATYKDWLARGATSVAAVEADEDAVPDEPWHSFYEQVAMAETRLEMTCLARMQTHGVTEHRALAWFMEKRWPTRYGPAARLTLVGDHDQPLVVQATITPAERAATTIRALQELGLPIPEGLLADDE